MGVQQTPLFEGERIEPKLRFTRVRHRNSSSASVLTSSVFSGILGTLTGSMRVNCQVLFVIAALTCAIAQQPPTRGGRTEMWEPSAFLILALCNGWLRWRALRT